MLLLDYRNPKEKFHKRIDNADLTREEVVVAIIPRSLTCEICNSARKFVWETMDICDDNGRPIRICPTCLAIYRRIEKLSEEEATEMLRV